MAGGGFTITWCSAKLLEATLIASIYYLHSCLCQIATQSEVLPKFLAPLGNHTVIQGREVSFTCIVNHLKDYRVAWIKSDSRAILAIHTHLVAHNPRISVTHNGHNTWKLHLSNVQKNDSGTYMCQVNTEPMLSQMGYMEVVVPPDIVDEKYSSPEGGGSAGAGEGGGGRGSEQVANEGGSVKLRCLATGTPEPNVTWRRENNSPIVLRGHRPHTHRVDKVDGEFLELNNVTREDMGTYLCIATNGIPPTVSKRYSVLVNFAPTIKVRENVVGAPVHTNVVLQCIVEASPAAMNTWLIGKDQKLLPTEKYNMSELQLNEYSWQMNLTIRALNKDDFGDYTCASVNALGTSEEKVRLQKTDAPPTTTTTTPQQQQQERNRPSNELRPGRKKQQQQQQQNSNKKHQHRKGASEDGAKTDRPAHRQHGHHRNNNLPTSSSPRSMVSSNNYPYDQDAEDNTMLEDNAGSGAGSNVQSCGLVLVVSLVLS